MWNQKKMTHRQREQTVVARAGAGEWVGKLDERGQRYSLSAIR